MTTLVRNLLPLAAAVALFGCGTPETSACASSCDCKATTQPQGCPGEWVCNAQQTCAYSCKGTCALGGVYTCRDGETCNGTICSEKLSCP